ncbi:MAG: hypothetical protein RL490_2648 [Pseudomonadota bacterium]|jgi:quinol monooxygenase YgiN
MIVIIGTIRIDSRHRTATLAAMQAMILASRAEPGCHRYGYAEDVLEPGLIHVHEVWDDADSLAAHFASPHIAAWRAQWPALGIHDRNLVRYSADAGTPA